MTTGSFGSVTTAVVCAASSFGMTITDPASFISKLDVAFLDAYKGGSQASRLALTYVEPNLKSSKNFRSSQSGVVSLPGSAKKEIENPKELGLIKSKVVTLGDLIDTDAVRMTHSCRR